MEIELTPEEIKDCEAHMDAMGFEKAPSSDTPKPIVRLHKSDVLRHGDRPLYADGTIGSPIPSCETGQSLQDSGYYGAYRKKPSGKDRCERE